ncbi:peroxiredoxin family protein [Haloferax larsenii]|uniref:Peroxiredoxin family protein n=1 Tax=Haloferax larsenii TaxID=302484 RepID=A0ABY5RG68_HALLR|nr:redoxin domain-containing protein [Haloferax larsenii]ELZ75991.1 thioredoxin-dependent hydroperoxide peroxidase [Haloferax larsenii JCM 13917]UVE51361.1 peroxiredoxin family protein [Haloferax larsenii]
MSASTHTLDFELPNVAAGPDVLSPATVDADFLLLLLQRDYYCKVCRRQVQSMKRRYDEFESRDAEVVSVLPDPPERAEKWQRSYDLPFPLLADPGADVGDEFDQPTRFGALGKLHDMVGRMPEAVLVDLRGDDPDVTYTHRGSSPSDRPEIDDLLQRIDRLAS